MGGEKSKPSGLHSKWKAEALSQVERSLQSVTSSTRGGEPDGRNGTFDLKLPDCQTNSACSFSLRKTIPRITQVTGTNIKAKGDSTIDASRMPAIMVI